MLNSSVNHHLPASESQSYQSCEVFGAADETGERKGSDTPTPLWGLLAEAAKSTGEAPGMP
ncbi:MAG: hypothetical protein U0992_21670 [Planctomycetaceae bacterium]